MSVRARVASITPDRYRRRVIHLEQDLRAWARVARGQLGPLPSFLLLGVQKGGSTSFWDHLQRLPEMNPHLPKEMLFFNRYAPRRPLSWYRARFWEPSAPHALQGDGTLTYLPSLHAPARAHRVVPDAKLVVLLRDPVERAISHYKHDVRRGEQPRPLMDVLREEQAELEAGASILFDHPRGRPPRLSYLRRGLYEHQLNNWLQHYRPEQLHIILSEDYFAHPVDEMSRFLDFLGGEYSATPPAVRSGERAKAVLDTREARALLSEFFAAPNEQLAQRLGKPGLWSE